jgi:16S rRNA (guanine527-N7)-methyltransferase
MRVFTESMRSHAPRARSTGTSPPDWKAAARDRLDQGLAALGLDLPPDRRDALLRYVALVVRWNAAYNLTAVRDPVEMVRQHLLDSLAIVPPLVRRLPLANARIVDIGSGAGLPGLILAILFPEATIRSVEPVGKKAAFQRQVYMELALTNVEVIAARAESLRGEADLVVCRAFASLDGFVRAAAGFIGPATQLAAMKGRRAEVDAELPALGDRWLADVEPITVPQLDAQRHLVVLRPAGDALSRT